MTVSSIARKTDRCTIEVRTEGDTAYVKCQGRLVYGDTDRFKEGVRELFGKSKRVVIDLGEVNFMDSAGLGAIVRLYVSAKAARCEFQLVNLGPRVRELFSVTRMLSLFESCGESNVKLP